MTKLPPASTLNRPRRTLPLHLNPRDFSPGPAVSSTRIIIKQSNRRMSRGGKRPGAGRPKGAVSKLSATAVAHAKATGELPHEFLLRVVRGECIDDQYPTLGQRIAAAVSAAPYFAPKLAAIEQRVETNIRTIVSSKPMTTEEWMKKYEIERIVLPSKP
jgi:hypothetical protein